MLPNLIGFCRYLRQHGLTVGANQVLCFVQALRQIDISQRDTFYHAAQASLLNRHQDREAFRQAFERYWRGRSWQGLVAGRPTPPRPKAEAAEERPVAARRWPIPEDGRHETAATSEGSGQQYSAFEILRRKDFADLSGNEREQVSRLAREIPLRLAARKSRRWVPGGGDRVELRRSLRLNLRQGGEWLRWAHRGPKIVDRPLLLLADISGSMETYSRILLHFAYGMVRGFHGGVEAFVFGTRLTRITRSLQRKGIQEAMSSVSNAVPDWSGGTRIGLALRRFNLDWARRVMARRPVVLIISDGWDRGDPRVLAAEVARLQRSAHILIWLNPRLGGTAFRPLTRGMQAALPHIDHFLPVHNLASLDQLTELLGRLPSADKPLGQWSVDADVRARGDFS